MNRSLIRYLFVVVVSAGLMAPAHAFDFSAWFTGLSNRSKNTLYVTTAAVVAGLSFLAYKMCSKNKANPKGQVLKEVEQADVVNGQQEPVRPGGPNRTNGSKRSTS